MQNCKLCKVNEADKTGSHIVPAFIIKNLFPRDKEFVYTIGKNITSHIGRGILPEKIEEFIGKSMTEQERKDNQIPFIVDYYFCSSCEKKLGYLESLYAKYIHQKIKNASDLEIKFLDKGNLISLFWYSVMWRISIHNLPLKLKLKDERKLQSILNSNLKDSSLALEQHLSNNEIVLCKYPIAILFNGKDNRERMNGGQITGHGLLRNPYLAFVNEYIILLYFKPTQVNSVKHLLYGIEGMYELGEIVNYNSNDIKVNLMSDDNWNTIMSNYHMRIAKFKFKEIDSFFEIAADHFNIKYTKSDLQMYRNKVIYSDLLITDKYSTKQLIKIASLELERISNDSKK